MRGIVETGRVARWGSIAVYMTHNGVRGDDVVVVVVKRALRGSFTITWHRRTSACRFGVSLEYVR